MKNTYIINQTITNKNINKSFTYHDAEIEIGDSQCFKYGNGKYLSYDFGDNSECFDIRYDMRYAASDELNYIREFLLDYWAERHCDITINLIMRKD